MEPLHEDTKPHRRPSQAGTFIVLLMAILATGITVFWIRGTYSWWEQYRIVSNSLPVVGTIEDIRFLRESNNKKYCFFELTYSYSNDVAPLRNSVEIAAPGSKEMQQADRFCRVDRLYQVGDELTILMSTADMADSIPADFVRSFRPHLSLGLVIAVLWLLFAIRARRLVRNKR